MLCKVFPPGVLETCLEITQYGISKCSDSFRNSAIFHSGQLCLEKFDCRTVRFFSSMNFKMFVLCRGIVRQRFIWLGQNYWSHLEVCLQHPGESQSPTPQYFLCRSCYSAEFPITPMLHVPLLVSFFILLLFLTHTLIKFF